MSGYISAEEHWNLGGFREHVCSEIDSENANASLDIVQVPVGRDSSPSGFLPVSLAAVAPVLLRCAPALALSNPEVLTSGMISTACFFFAWVGIFTCQIHA